MEIILTSACLMILVSYEGQNKFKKTLSDLH